MVPPPEFRRADMEVERFTVSFSSPTLTFTRFGIGSTAPFLNLILIISFPCTSTAVTWQTQSPIQTW
ncbi:hypothetical protein pCPXV0036 [Cowpox virus]|uniref:Uncharacterized protein n=1 Tax=Cowpox virus TaxID=10243 RepID=A0A0K2YTI7_COWPX|nr:hypothetical protein pCPXV0036 [Cowpox virus]SNB49437.1 hypothetical protein pCPXV0036 [Cowpox virus]